jgi:hypothetical protein
MPEVHLGGIGVHGVHGVPHVEQVKEALGIDEGEFLGPVGTPA